MINGLQATAFFVFVSFQSGQGCGRRGSRCFSPHTHAYIKQHGTWQAQAEFFEEQSSLVLTFLNYRNSFTSRHALFAISMLQDGLIVGLIAEYLILLLIQKANLPNMPPGHHHNGCMHENARFAEDLPWWCLLHLALPQAMIHLAELGKDCPGWYSSLPLIRP